MLSFKRFLYIVLIVAVMGGIFLVYSIRESRPASAPAQGSLALEREFTEIGQVEGGEKPRVWILGGPGEGRCGEIYDNVRQFCEGIHLTVVGEGHLDMDETGERDLVIFCDASVSPYADPAELGEFIAGGGRVILAAGLSEEDGDACLWEAFGIREKSPGGDCHHLVFEKPLLPVQPEEAYYDGNSGSARIQVDETASVYVRDGESAVPLLHTYVWQKGSVCLINGTFLADIRCMGLLTGAISVLLPDFVYPVLGVKAMFLDRFPMVTPADDELCRQMYGYSAEGFVRDVVWPAFQGISLRTDTPCTASILAETSSEERFEAVNDTLFAAVGRSVLQFGGELVYAAGCPKEGEIVLDQDFISRFSEMFPGYTIQGLAMETDTSSSEVPEKPEMPGTDVRFIRGRLGSRDMGFSWEAGRTVFPVATRGNEMEEGNLFAICSVLGAYGMVSHAFDGDRFITGQDGAAAWDLDKRQISLFESQVLNSAPWLEGRTLRQTEGDVRSYQDMDYGYGKSGNRLELTCSGVAKGQAFFYHTDSPIVEAKGLTYRDVGNGYYLLRIQENHGSITLEEGK